jgi:hypothetical protein
MFKESLRFRTVPPISLAAPFDSLCIFKATRIAFKKSKFLLPCTVVPFLARLSFHSRSGLHFHLVDMHLRLHFCHVTRVPHFD